MGIKCVVMVSLWVFVFLSTAAASELERKLYEKLEKDSHPLERPVESATQTVNVSLDFTLLTIDVLAKEQLFVVNGWLGMRWHAYNLVWRPEEFENISQVVLQHEKIWKPDLVIYNSLTILSSDNNPSASYDGTVLWFRPGVLQLSCKLEMQYFPFDEQLCHIKIASWAYGSYSLDFDPSPAIQMESFTQSGEWSIKDMNSSILAEKYGCCAEQYPSVYFFFRIRRRALFYITNFIFPCCIITISSFAGLLLPAEGGEKATLQVSVMLAVSVFMQLIMGMTPETSESIPLMTIFFSCCFALVAMAMMVTAVTQQMHHYRRQRMGNTTRYVLLRLCPKLLFMSSFEPKPIEDLTEPLPTPKVEKCTAAGALCSAHCKQLIQMLNDLYDIFKVIEAGFEFKRKENVVRDEWKFAARVTDRICLVILTAALVAAVVFTLTFPPYKLEL